MRRRVPAPPILFSFVFHSIGRSIVFIDLVQPVYIVRRKISIMPDYIPGIDVSHFQGDVDWAKVKNAGIAYAFVKATDGTSFVDSTFKTNWAAIQDAGLLR